MGRHLGWYDPVTRGPIMPACSMAHLDYIYDKRGDMTELNERELQAVFEAVEPMLRDIRDFPFETAPDDEIYEFCAYLYQQICDKAVPF